MEEHKAWKINGKHKVSTAESAFNYTLKKFKLTINLTRLTIKYQ